VLFYIADRLPRFTTGAMDARGNGQYLAETSAQRYGALIVQVMLSESWYRENMPRYKAAFEDGTIEIPKDADVLADHRAIVLEQGADDGLAPRAVELIAHTRTFLSVACFRPVRLRAELAPIV